MKKICIVPVTVDVYPIINFLQDIYTIEALVAPEGIGIDGKDISILRNRNPTGYCFTNSLNAAINRSDVVLISDVSKKQCALYVYAYNALQEAVKCGKEVLCYLNLTSDQKEKILYSCSISGAECQFFHSSNEDLKKYPDEFTLCRINIPVIYIGELIPDCDSYDVFLGLAHQLKKGGRNVLAISEDPYNSLFGFYTMNFSSKLEVKNQIYRINQTISSLVNEKHPDMILLRFPLPMIGYDEANPFDCGGMAFIISQALKGDGCIVCSQANAFPQNTWNEINDLFQKKYGYPIIGIHRSNKLIDITSGNILSTIFIPVSEVYCKGDFKNDYDFPVCYLLDMENCSNFCDTINKKYFDLPYGII